MRKRDIRSAEGGGGKLTPVISLENVTHVYSAGTPFEMEAVRGVSLDIYKGEFLGIIGHTGSGKSTLIQHLNGLIKPTSGKIYFNGNDIFSSKELTRDMRFKVGLVFQYPEYQLFEETVYKDIAFGPKNMKLSDEEIESRVYEAARFVRLPESVLKKSPFELSGGQKRRAAIAGVIAMSPEVLVLDEPTAGLDPRGCEEIIDNIKEYHEEKNAAVVMVSHSMEDVAQNADRMIVMCHGRIAMEGTPREVFTREKELHEMGLSVPEVTHIAHCLKEKGLSIDASVYTIDQLVRELLRLKGGASK